MKEKLIMTMLHLGNFKIIARKNNPYINNNNKYQNDTKNIKIIKTHNIDYSYNNLNNNLLKLTLNNFILLK